MAVPTFQELFLPILKYLGDGQERTKKEVAEHLSQIFQLTHEDLSELLPSGKQTKFLNRIAWTRTYFCKALLIESTDRGKFRITNRGRDLLATSPTTLDVKSLNQFFEFRAFHQGNNETPKKRVLATFR